MPNAFYRRRALAAQVARDKRDLEAAELAWDMDRICREYEKLYSEYYGMTVIASYVKGWFCAHGRRWRRKAFEDKINLLRGRLHEVESPRVD